MAMPKATVSITKPCKTMSIDLKFHKASGNETSEEMLLEGVPTETRRDGTESSIAAMVARNALLKGFL